ncbi:hypothetical protein BJ138DRAFT_525798 [Hygrophoropsis aurantiaca]|uniref:Uncharacterized protein n=1 Tax=Hygrophoropsis aurantiaca TaxID=72124 RepID=A0ACB8A242_9AGAM|nr:hypothetical protein BJ138DRAFT_525798 [Hygrophoropsis aurantiaca]
MPGCFSARSSSRYSPANFLSPTYQFISEAHISEMDSFTNFVAIFSTAKIEDVNAPSSTPADEDSSSSGGNSYCVIA